MRLVFLLVSGAAQRVALATHCPPPVCTVSLQDFDVLDRFLLGDCELTIVHCPEKEGRPGLDRFVKKEADTKPHGRRVVCSSGVRLCAFATLTVSMETEPL